AQDPFVWHGEFRPEQPLHARELLSVESGEQIEPADQFAGVQAEIEARPVLRPSDLIDAAPEIVVDLPRDQSLLEERLIAAHFAARRRLAQELRFERRGVVGIMVA